MRLHLAALLFLVITKAQAALPDSTCTAPTILTLHQLENEVDLLPFLYHTDNGRLQAFTEVIERLPVNQAHTFIVSIKNASPNLLQQVVQFSPDFVQAMSVVIKSQCNDHAVFHWQNHWSLTLAPGETATLRITLRELDRLNTKRVSLILRSVVSYNNNKSYTDKTQSFFLGLLAFLSVFNLILYFVTKWKVYIRYTLYITAALAYFLFYYGFLQEAFPLIKHISINLISTWYPLVFIFYFYFLNEFAQYKTYSPWAYKLLNVGIINKCIQVGYETILNPLGAEFIYSVWYKNTVLIGETVLMAFIIYFILKNKNVRGRIVVIASLMLIIGAILGQLNFDPAIRGTFIQLGITAELLTFSIGLGYFTREFYLGQQQAQTQLIEQLRENENMQTSMREELERTVKQRTAELEARNRENEILLAEVHHRVKNNLQIISSLINIKTGNSSISPDEILAQLNGRIFSMGLLHEKLYNKKNLRSLRLDLYLQELINHLLSTFQDAERPVQIVQKLQEVIINADEALTCGLIYNEVFTNSMKHAFSADQINREIVVELTNSNNVVSLSVYDNGIKEKELPSLQESFGLRFVNQLVHSKLKGSWTMTTESGFQTTILFPASSSQ